MRGLVAFLCGVLALVAGLVTLPIAWVSHNIADEDGYVAFTEPLATNPGFQTAIADALATGLVEKSGLPAVTRKPAQRATSAALLGLAAQPGWVQAWDDTQRQSHQITLGDQGNLPAALDASNRLAVDFGPMAQFVVKIINQQIPFRLPAPQQLIVTVGGNQQTYVIEQLRKTPDWSRTGLLVTGLLAALSLVVARRRSVALAWLGAGTIAVAGVAYLAFYGGASFIAGRDTATSSFAQSMTDVMIERSRASFGHWTLVLAGAGVIAVGFGAVARRVFSGRSRS